MSKYSEADFREAQFARTEDGLVAMRAFPDRYEPWIFVTTKGTTALRTDSSMPREDWVPVTGPTITRSQLDHAREVFRDLPYPPSALRAEAFLGRACGAKVVPDPDPDPDSAPMPTNTEKLAEAIRAACVGIELIPPASRRSIAEHLDEQGVKAPGGDEPGARHDRSWWIENANVNDAEDCEACVGDLCPVHHGMAVGIDMVAKKLAALGDDPELFNSIPNPLKTGGGDV